MPREEEPVTQALLEEDARAILAAPPGAVTAPGRDWDRRSRSRAMSQTGRRLALQPQEWAALSRNGFVVLDRVPYANPYEAFKDIYRQELPLFVSADSILHTVFLGHRELLEAVEPALADRTQEALGTLHAALGRDAPSWPEESARDLDLYLTVARSLLADTAVAPRIPATGAEAERWVTRVERAEGLETVELFGRTRVVDFTVYAPRGPYAADESRRRWFRAAMWLSRLEFNVLSRDCRSSQPGIVPVPEETPREALDAFALAELARTSNTLPALSAVADAWTRLAGRREDLSLQDLERVRASAGVSSLRAADAFERLKLALGASFARTARTHPMPQGVRSLPAIATVFGPRVVPDAALTRPLVHDEVPGRYSLHAADLAYALGHEGAGRHLAAEFTAYPLLREGFTRARAIAQAPVGEDVYGQWFGALRALTAPPSGVLPSFVRGPAWDDFRMNTLVVGYGQLRHNNVLLASSSYDGAACRIPDAYVEPTPGLYDALLGYTAAVRRVLSLAGLAAADAANWSRYLDETERTLRVLQRIVADELRGAALTAAQRRFLGSVAEVLPSSDGYPLHTGWYLDLFPGDEVAQEPVRFIADWYASVNDGTVSYVGARGVRLGLFVVDRGGAPRLMVGPVSQGYEHLGPLARRLTDRAAGRLPATERLRPWARSYLVEALPSPALTLEPSEQSTNLPQSIAVQVRASSPTRLGPVTLELLGHRLETVARARGVATGAGSTLALRWLPGVYRAYQARLRAGRGADEALPEVCGWRVTVGRWTHQGTNFPSPEYGAGPTCEEMPYLYYHLPESDPDAADEGSEDEPAEQ